MELSEIEVLLAEFDKLPKKIKEPTYLEICKYPGSRFEEICSRLLCFFLDPQKEHGFKDLFLRSLFEILVPQKEFLISLDDIHVINEENAEGKRLDILIHSSNFVIGIENKITAGIYNPFEIYKNQIHLYGKANENKFGIVLSLRKISNKDDLAFIHSHDFINLTYKVYFEKIKLNLGVYLSNCNQKYLLFLTDFIQTLDNMDGSNILNEELSNYFFDNFDKVEELTSLFQQFNNKTLSTQIERIGELKGRIIDITQNDDWEAFEGWCLVFSKFKTDKPQIGIECGFEKYPTDQPRIYNGECDG